MQLLLGDTPLDTSRYRLGTLAVITLVALRLSIGWHFFKEGTDKIKEPSWTAAHFFTGSKGPLKPLFETMVWDGDGRARLGYKLSKGGWPVIDTEPTLTMWQQYRGKVEQHYGFDEQQLEKSKQVFELWEAQLNWYLDANKDKILEYFHGLDRRKAIRADAARQSVESLRGQSDKTESELTAAAAPWLAQINGLWRGYDDALNALATPEQQANRLQLGKLSPGFLNTNLIDKVIPWFDTLVGALLIVGLCTRLASLAGAGFLFSIVLTQWPGYPGTQPTYYQTIEMLGMLVLAATAAGQFAGLDFVLCSYWSRFKHAKQEKHS